MNGLVHSSDTQIQSGKWRVVISSRDQTPEPYLDGRAITGIQDWPEWYIDYDILEWCPPMGRILTAEEQETKVQLDKILWGINSAWDAEFNVDEINDSIW